jgi:nitrile hydratase accessory protein
MTTQRSAQVDRFVADADASGADALPRRNGELVFDTPWESRSFGMAISLAHKGLIEWEAFRGQLIEEIGAWEAGHAPDSDDWSYYEHWLASLEHVLLDGELLTAEEVETRMAEVAEAQAHEHEHGHGHGHSHSHSHGADGAKHPQTTLPEVQ